MNETGQNIFLITNAGLTIIKLDAVPLSIGSLTPSTGAPGTMVKIRGSGFQSGTTVSLNGTTAASNFVDDDTLEITVPAIGSGTAKITCSTPDGTSYNLDAGFTVQ